MGLTPDFKIEVNEKDVTDNVKKHLVSLSLKDEAGNKTDEINLTLDNLYKRPEYKDKIKIYLGYKESGLYFCGIFMVQTTEKNQNSLTIRATSVNFTIDLKKKHNRSFENITLSDLVGKIANEHNLNYKCDFKDVYFKHLAQTNESNLNLLNRLANMYHATFNIKNNTIIFIEKSNNETLPVFEINKDEVENYSIKYANKTLYKSTKAIYHDTKENKTREITYGNEKPQFILQDSFKSKEEALKKAKGILNLLNAGSVNGSLTITGRNIIAGAKLKLSGFGEDDGEYSIKRVHHNLSGSGYIIRMEFEK